MDQDNSTLSKARLTELGAGKYHEWNHCLLTYARAERLSKYIEKDLNSPTPSEKDEFEYHDPRPLSLIHATIDSDNCQIIASCNRARSAFLALCKHHDDGGGLSTAMIFSKLVTMKLNEGEYLNKYLFEFRSHHNKLTGNLVNRTYLKISNPCIAIILLTSLPQLFSALIQTTLSDFDNINLDRVYLLLNMEANRQSGLNVNEDTVLVAKIDMSEKRKKPVKKEAFNRNLSCSLGHLGHPDDTCRDKMMQHLRKEVAELKKGKTRPPQEYSAKVEVDTSEDESAHWEEEFHTSLTTIDRRIIFDSGSTNHMFKDRHLLRNLKPISPSRIGVASKGTTIWAKEAGNVDLPGIKLTGVLFSNQLSSNLVSIGKLCNLGLTAIFKGNEGRIIDQSGMALVELCRDKYGDRLWHPKAAWP